MLIELQRENAPEVNVRSFLHPLNFDEFTVSRRVSNFCISVAQFSKAHVKKKKSFRSRL